MDDQKQMELIKELERLERELNRIEEAKTSHKEKRVRADEITLEALDKTSEYLPEKVSEHIRAIVSKNRELWKL
jgi:hypothetical protein